MPEQGSVITTLAILKVNWDHGQDYIDMFVPLVAEYLRRSPNPAVTVQELQSALREQFALEAPRGAVRTILNRAKRRGLVRKAGDTYHKNLPALQTGDFEQRQAAAVREYNALLQKLIEYCAAHHGTRWTEAEADAALAEYLQDRAVPVLASILHGSPMPAPARKVKGGEFLVSAFIQHLYSNEPDGFRFLETVVKGSMLASVLFLPDLGRVVQRFGRMAIYFDTPFLLRVLGCEGSERHASCRELVDLLYRQGVDLRCFEHTVAEVRGVLDAAAWTLRDPRRASPPAFGPTLQHLISSGATASDVERLIATLDQRLGMHRIRVIGKPPVLVTLSVDEQRWEEILRREVRYRSDEALRHDLECLTAIFRLREGGRELWIENCKAIFVTTNEALVRAAVAACGDGGVPLAVTDSLIATLAWLKMPSVAAELPRRQLIARCYAALSPSDELWREYLEEAARLQASGEISAEEYYALRFSTVARSELMRLTRGDIEAVSPETVRQVIRATRDNLRAEVKAEAEAEIERRRAEIEKERDELRRTRAALERQRGEQFERIQVVADRVARICSWAVFGLALLMILGVTVVSTLSLNAVGALWVGPMVGFIAIVITVLNLVFGTTVRRLQRFVEIRVRDRIGRWLWQLFGVGG